MERNDDEHHHMGDVQLVILHARIHSLSSPNQHANVLVRAAYILRRRWRMVGLLSNCRRVEISKDWFIGEPIYWNEN